MYEVTMPKLSDSMEVGKIIEWRVAEGDAVSEGDVLAEVESDKASMELECFHDGTIAKLVFPNDTEVPVGETIALIAGAGEETAEAPAAEKPAPKPKAPPADVHPVQPQQEERKPSKKPAPSADRIAASPYARKLAQEKGVDLSRVTGTGPDGRIVARDIQGAAGKPQPKPAKPAEKAETKPAAAKSEPTSRDIEPAAKVLAGKMNVDLAACKGTGLGGRITVDDVLAQVGTKVPEIAPSPDEELPPLEVTADEADVEDAPFRIKTQARRTSAATHVIPHFFVTRGAEVSALLALKPKLKKAGAGVTHAIMAASLAAIAKHPEVNRTYDHGKLIKWKNVNLGLAVAAEGGLTVAVVKAAQAMKFAELVERTGDLVDRARKGKLRADERTHATFTISNLGMYDVEHFAPIINPPSAITLAVASALDTPIVRDGALAPGKVMRLTLACDHRVLDGVAAAEFLRTLKELLEAPGDFLDL